MSTVRHIPRASITITETRAHRFQHGTFTAFVLTAGYIVGKTNANGGLQPFAVPALDVVIRVIHEANKFELERVKEAIKEREEKLAA